MRIWLHVSYIYVTIACDGYGAITNLRCIFMLFVVLDFARTLTSTLDLDLKHMNHHARPRSLWDGGWKSSRNPRLLWGEMVVNYRTRLQAIDTRRVEDRFRFSECKCNLYNVTKYKGCPLRLGYTWGLNFFYDEMQCRVGEGFKSIKRGAYLRYTVNWVDREETIVPVKSTFLMSPILRKEGTIRITPIKVMHIHSYICCKLVGLTLYPIENF